MHLSEQALNDSKLRKKNATKFNSLSLYTEIHHTLVQLNDLKLFTIINMTKL